MDIVDELRVKPNRPTVKIALGNGTEIDVPGLGYIHEDDRLRSQAANRIEEIEKERDRLLVLATKHCPRDHHDWDEILNIASDT